MGGIPDTQVEWAVVNRLRAMLREPPPTEFNVTQSFALFATVLVWTKNRAWVAGRGNPHGGFVREDFAAHAARERLRHAIITEEPWSLSTVAPELRLENGEITPGGVINTDFVGMTAEAFVNWLRHAIAHGDGRNIRPLHKNSRRTERTWLAGFFVEAPAARGSVRTLRLSLYHQDMVRLGIVLADVFCESLSGGTGYANEDVATARVTEVTG